MPRPRVLLDVDGVLADFLTPSLTILTRLSGREWVPSDFPTWDLFDTVPRKFEQPFYDAVNTPGWCRDIPVHEDSVEGVARLREHADIYIVTSPMNHVPTWTHEREQWLKAHFGIEPKKVVHTSAKYICRGDVLVDDRPSNIEAWEAEHPDGVGLLWDQPYNRDDDAGVRVRTWAQVRLIVAGLPGNLPLLKQGIYPW